MIEIRNRYTEKIIFKSKKAKNIKEAVEEAVENGTNLSEADLSGAYLSRADLSGAYLSRADLSGANLSGANLSRAKLSEANLYRADLSRAYLSEAKLCFCKMDKKVFNQITKEWFEWEIKEGVDVE